MTPPHTHTHLHKKHNIAMSHTHTTKHTHARNTKCGVVEGVVPLESMRRLGEPAHISLTLSREACPPQTHKTHNAKCRRWGFSPRESKHRSRDRRPRPSGGIRYATRRHTVLHTRMHHGVRHARKRLHTRGVTDSRARGLGVHESVPNHTLIHRLTVAQSGGGGGYNRRPIP